MVWKSATSNHTFNEWALSNTQVQLDFPKCSRSEKLWLDTFQLKTKAENSVPYSAASPQPKPSWACVRLQIPQDLALVFYEQHPPAERSQPAAVCQGKPWTTLLRDGMQKYLVLRRLKTTLSVIRCCRFFFLKRGTIIGGLIKSLLHRTVLPVTLNVLRFTAGIHCARWHLSFRKHGMTNPHKRFVGSCTHKRNSDRVLAFQST